MFTFPFLILLKPWTLSFKKATITTKIVSQPKYLHERKKLRFTLLLKDLILHFLVEAWKAFPEAMLAMKVEWRWGKTDLTNLNLLTILSAYTLPWYTRTWFNTTSFDTWRFLYCVVFPLFQSWKPGTLNPLDSTLTIRQLNTYNSDRCSKNHLIVFKMTWEPRAVKKYPWYLSVLPALFWCLENRPTVIPCLKNFTRRLL